MDISEKYMYRCLELARLGAGSVAPNPMVGAVLVYENRIIGEGWHRQYGEAHAEVNCINSVTTADALFITSATLYVSLEPCAHYGKTPPCSDLIIAKGIPQVVIGCRDPFKAVDGKGIEKLRKAGVAVTIGVLEEACQALNKRFFTFHATKRPYIILKWAQTTNQVMASNDNTRLFISNAYTNRLVHQWRSQEAAILIGTRTARLDDPLLNNRLWSGKSPVKMVIDRELALPGTLQLFNGPAQTIVFNCIKQELHRHIRYKLLTREPDLLPQLLETCYELQILSVLVEGGKQLLQHFIDNGTWDEARIITNRQLHFENGLSSPVLTNALIKHEEQLDTDHIAYYTPNNP